MILIFKELGLVKLLRIHIDSLFFSLFNWNFIKKMRGLVTKARMVSTNNSISR